MKNQILSIITISSFSIFGYSMKDENSNFEFFESGALTPVYSMTKSAKNLTQMCMRCNSEKLNRIIHHTINGEAYSKAVGEVIINFYRKKTCRK